MDDMTAKSREGENHVQILKELFERPRKYKLRLNHARCSFGVKSGKLLGFMISDKKIEVDLEVALELNIRKINVEVEEIKFTHLGMEGKHFADALVTLTSMARIDFGHKTYPMGASKINKKTLKRLAMDFNLDGETLHKKSSDRIVEYDGEMEAIMPLEVENPSLRFLDSKFRRGGMGKS
ncbi:hypothetical protein Peur_032982 [Populus x canadensis]